MKQPRQAEGTLRPEAERNLSSYLPDLTAGLVNGLLILIFQSAYAALIFSGDLSPFLARGLGYMLFGATAMGLIVALTSSYPGTVTAPQDAPTAIMAIVAGSLAGAVVPIAGQDAAFVTVVAAMAVTALMTGIFLFFLGWFNLGNLIRFIPFPVVGGFLAGTGWILVMGGLSVTTRLSVSLDNFLLLFETTTLMKWLPAAIFAVVLYVLQRRFRGVFVLPLLIFAALVMFYGALYFSGLSILAAADEGWLLAGMPDGLVWQPLAASELEMVEIAAIIREGGSLLTIMLICTISLLLNASGLELAARREIDLNKELRSSGLANVVSGLGGSSSGYLSLSLTNLGYRIGARHRLSSLTSAGLCGLALLAGTGLSAFIPRLLLGGLLLYLGLVFLVDWIYHAWRELPRSEYVLVLVITVTIGAMGFLQGMILGILISVVLFVISYSRVDVIKHTLSGKTYQSNVDRDAHTRRLLMQHGAEIHILQLQGYIFFGTANRLYSHLRDRLQDNTSEPPHFILLDFHLVNGLDASALHSFAKMKMLAARYDVTLILSGLLPQLKHKFVAGGIVTTEAEHIFSFEDMDRAMEWAEDTLLGILRKQEHTSSATAEGSEFLAALLSGSDPQSADQKDAVSRFGPLGERMLHYLRRIEFGEGEHLIEQSSPPSGMYIIERGSVTVRLTVAGRKEIRLRKMGAGTVVGELGVYLRTPATASVVAGEESVAYYLSIEALERMESADPDLAAVIHKFIARILGERVINSNSTIRALMR